MAGKRPPLLPPINQKHMPPDVESVHSSPPLSARSGRSLRSQCPSEVTTVHSSRHRSNRTPNPPTRRVVRQRSRGQRTSTAADGGHQRAGRGHEQQGVLITQLHDLEDHSDSDYDTDLESDSSGRRKRRKPKKRVKKKVEEESHRVVTEKQLYMKMCRNFGVVPVSYYVRNMEEPDLRMRYHGLGPCGTKALSVPLQINTCVTNLDLEGNWMEAEGARHIAFMLKENMYITELNLSYNRLRSTGAQLICKTIKKNMQLKKLDLSGNGFLDKDSQYFREMLEVNTTLRELNLSNNEFSESGATTIGRGIAANDTVEEMDLSWNHIRLAGAEGIARGVKRNNGLVRLNLAMNGFASTGAKALGVALESNNTLTTLDLSNNRVDVDGCNSLAKALSRNDTLKRVHIGLNPITYSGAMTLLKAIEQNNDSTVELLDLMGVLVHHEFMHIASTIKQQRQFDVKVGFVSTGKELEANGNGFSDKNPLEILLIFMSEQNLRLVDLFKSMDKDQSMSLTREEFIEGLKTVNTPLSQSQLDQLIDMLDKDGDGEVDLKEIMNINREYRDIKMRARKKVSEERALRTKMRAAAAMMGLGASVREQGLGTDGAEGGEWLEEGQGEDYELEGVNGDETEGDGYGEEGAEVGKGSLWAKLGMGKLTRS